MGRVGALAATLGQEAALAAEGEQCVEQQGVGFAGHEAGAELTQDQGVKTGIGQVEAEQVLPVDASPYGIGSTAVGQVLGKLQQRDQRQPPGAGLAQSRLRRGREC